MGPFFEISLTDFNEVVGGEGVDIVVALDVDVVVILERPKGGDDVDADENTPSAVFCLSSNCGGS